VVKVLCYKSEDRWFDPSWWSTQPLTGVPGAFPGGKDGRCVRLTTLPLSCAVVMKSRNLNFLEPSGPLQVCNGTAFTRIRDLPGSNLGLGVACFARGLKWFPSLPAANYRWSVFRLSTAAFTFDTPFSLSDQQRTQTHHYCHKVNRTSQ